MSISLYDMYCFKLIAENLNFTKASKMLEESQPSLSKKIKKIEDHLGYELFKRNTRTMILTAEGSAFYDFSSKTLKLYDELKDRLARKNSILKIGYYYEWQFQMIVSLHSELSRYSDLKIELVKCREESLEEDVDLYFTVVQKFAEKYKHRYIASNGLSAYVSIYHQLAKNRGLMLKDLIDEKLITIHMKSELGEVNYYGKQIYDMLIDRGIQESHIIFDKDRMDMICQIYSENRIAIMYDQAMLLENSEIVKIPLADLRDQFPVYLIYKDPRKVEGYLNYLEKTLALD